MLVSGVQWNNSSVQPLSLCDTMDCTTPGLPVHPQLLELAQTHVHWVSHAIQPSHPQSILLSLLAILWNSAFKWVYLSFPPLLFTSFLFSAICKASSDNHFAFLHFFFLGMVSIPASCTMSWISVHSSSGTLSDLIPWIYFSLPLHNHKGFDLGHTWMV